VAVYLRKEFLQDLQAAADLRIVRRVLKHVLTADGSFPIDADDHRYHGIKDAWIRYVSKGNSAYRVIYIRSGADVFLYRAGPHSIEDRLSAPSEDKPSFKIAETVTETTTSRQWATMTDLTSLLKTKESKYLRKHIEGMFHVKHKEVCIVSPFIDFSMLEGHHVFGRFLDRAVEEDTMIIIVTSTSHGEETLPQFKALEERGMNTFFVDYLHSKVFLFDVDVEALHDYQRGVEPNVVIGSSNMTSMGLGFSNPCNEELNCCLSAALFEETKTYVNKLRLRAADYRKYERTFFKFRGK
jgi:phosphatidylserine/phosphatidylglycerophosphate/cardiolipin synthase-like enzyme